VIGDYFEQDLLDACDANVWCATRWIADPSYGSKPQDGFFVSQSYLKVAVVLTNGSLAILSV